MYASNESCLYKSFLGAYNNNYSNNNNSNNVLSNKIITISYVIQFNMYAYCVKYVINVFHLHNRDIMIFVCIQNNCHFFLVILANIYTCTLSICQVCLKAGNYHSL